MQMTSIVQPKSSLSGNTLSFTRPNFVHLSQHFPTKEICQARETLHFKSLVHAENLQHGEKYHSLSLDPKRTQFPKKSRSYNSFIGEFTEKNDSKSMKDEEKSASARQTLTHSDYNNTAALENRTNGSTSLQHPDVNGTAHSEYPLTNQREDMKHPLTNSLGKGVIRPVPLIGLYTPKPPLSNGERNTTQHLNDTTRGSWKEGCTEYGFETNSVQNGGDIAASQIKNRRDLVENVGHRDKRKSNVKETIYYSTGDHMATDSTIDSTASYTSATGPFQSVKENGKLNSENNGTRASYRTQETHVTVRNSTYQKRIESGKAGGNYSDHSHSQGAKEDVRKNGSNGVEAQNPRRVIRVVSLKDKDFLSRAKRNTIGQVSRSHSSSLPHEKTSRSTNGGDVPPITPLTRPDTVQEIIPRPKFEEVNGEQSKMATSEEVSRKSENRVRVEVKVNLQPQNIATAGVAGHELRSTEKETLTFEKVQGKDALDSGTVKSVITENDSLTSLEPRELETNTKVVEGQWKLPKIDNEKQYMPQKQVVLQKQLSVKLVTETEKQNPNDKDDLVNGLTKVSRTNQLQLADKLDILPINGAMNSECFNEILPNKDRENVESVTQIYKVNSNHLDLDQLPNESFARKYKSPGGYENFREVKQEIKNTFADIATEKDKCLQSVPKIAESTPQSIEKERDSQDPQPPGNVKREVQLAKKQKSSRRVRRAMTISTMNEEITEAMRQFYELSADSWHRKDDLTQSGNNLDTTGQPCKDGVQTINEGVPNNQEDSSVKKDVLERNYSLEPRLWRLPVRRPLSRSNTVITDDRSYLKHLSEEVRTMLILDARQRKLSADKTHRRNKASPEENKLKIDTERESILSSKHSEEVICPRHLDSIDILKFETLPLEERHFGKALNKERNGVVGKIRTEELREEMSSEKSTKLTDVSPAETSCDHVLPDVTDSVVVHEFSELISASTSAGDHTYIESESSNTGSLALNRSNDYLYESGDMLTQAVKSMVILAASEQYMKQVEALATAEYEALRRRPRMDGKVFLPRRPLHQNSLPENDTFPLTKTNQESEEN